MRLVIHNYRTYQLQVDVNNKLISVVIYIRSKSLSHIKIK